MKLTDFQSWQSDMEYLADEEECKRRTEWQLAMYRKQMREQKPGMFVSGKQLLKLFGWIALWAGVVGAIVWMAVAR